MNAAANPSFAWLHLASAALPVGAFSHSLGLEAALDAGLVGNAEQAERWIEDYLTYAWAGSEAPLWKQLFQAWERLDETAIRKTQLQLQAMRDTAELRRESEQTGHALRQWLLALPALDSLDAPRRQLLESLQPPAWACVHACAAQVLGLDEQQGLYALGWSLAENLVTAAVKLLPLGQRAGQTMLYRHGQRLPALIQAAQGLPLEQISNFTPMLGILSARHETQYTRLFRS